MNSLMLLKFNNATIKRKEIVIPRDTDARFVQQFDCLKGFDISL
jgi:hypothetical protein